jgi:hypothetical protein
MASRVHMNRGRRNDWLKFLSPPRVVALWSRVRKTVEATYLRVVFASDRRPMEWVAHGCTWCGGAGGTIRHDDGTERANGKLQNICTTTVTNVILQLFVCTD